MATCFDNLIGIKSDCALSTGSSAFYIEDIGLTVDECSLYINKNYRNGRELIDDKLAFSAQLVKNTVINHFDSHIISKSLIDSQQLGNAQDSLSLKAGAVDTLGGINLSLQNSNSYYKVYINSLSLQVNVTQDVDVLVYNLVTGELLDTLTIPCVANKISTVFVNKTYQSDKRKLDIILVYDTEGISSNTTYLNGDGCLHCNGYKYSNAYISSAAVTIDEGSSKIRSSLVGVNHTYGMSINYSVQCAIENWACEISNLLALPILYKFGEEIMNYSLYYSDRQNSKTIIDLERNKERLAMYKEEYNKSLMATVKKINLPIGDACFKCDGQVRSAIILP